VTQENEIYVADTGNQRILHIDAERNLVKSIQRPEDETIDQEGDFLPLKLVVDEGGRIFTLVRNYNKGLVQFKNDGEFAGYMGASEVKFNMIDYIWKLLSSREQRDQLAQFVPTEYNNIYMDKDGFIYATTSVFNEAELLSDQAKPIRKLNAMGNDILIKNGNYPPIGDVDWGNSGGISGASKFIDVTALENGLYYALDRTRGRIFGYDSQGELLYAFGGLGNQKGYFQYPTALENHGTDLYVLDGRTGNISVLKITDYGKLINAGIATYERGQYFQSAKHWEEVLKLNGNYDLAYIGIGRSYIRQGNYEEAMAYFKLKNSDENYSKAFKHYRKQWIEENIVWMFGVVVCILVLPQVLGTVKRIKREVEEA
jgi:tetratricopeptide (TPR) repeat protein